MAVGDPVQHGAPLAGQRLEDRVADERLTLVALGGQPAVRLGDLGLQLGEVAVHLGPRPVRHLRQFGRHIRAGDGRAGAHRAVLAVLALGDRLLSVTPVITHPSTVLPGPGGRAAAGRRGRARARLHALPRSRTWLICPPVLGRRNLGHGDNSAEDHERADNCQQTLAPRVAGRPARPCGPAHRIALLLDPVVDSCPRRTDGCEVARHGGDHRDLPGNASMADDALSAPSPAPGGRGWGDPVHSRRSTGRRPGRFNRRTGNCRDPARSRRGAGISR